MKYTRYIIYGKPLNFDNVGILAIPSAFIAIPIMIFFLSGAIIMDSGRFVKLKYIFYNKNLKKEKYIKHIIKSLDHKETKELINLLKTI